MGNYVCFLITILHKATGTAIDCALRVERDSLTGDCGEYPMEPENRGHLHDLLPEHVKSCGPVIKVSELFEIHSV